LLESATAHHPWELVRYVTVPVDEFRPQHAGFSESEEERRKQEQKIARIQDCGMGSFCETATNFVAEII